MSTGTAMKTPGIDGGPMGRFEVANCIVSKRLTARIEKFLRDQRTGNIRLNIKDGKILGAHVEEFVSFKPAAGNGARRRPECPN